MADAGLSLKREMVCFFDILFPRGCLMLFEKSILSFFSCNFIFLHSKMICFTNCDLNRVDYEKR